jgi:hypothetical protein
VKALGLDAMKPSLAFRTDRMRSILPLGEDMGPSLTTQPKDTLRSGEARL